METTSTLTTPPVVLPSDDIANIPFVPLGPMEGVTHLVLWHDATSIVGILRVEAGRRLGRHTHRANSHHMWVLDGTARILDADLLPGSYVHIPVGVDHDIEAVGDKDCLVLYVYAPS